MFALTSNSVAFNFPNADGTDGQVLKTDGSGTLSFITASANTPSSADGQALGSTSLEWSDLLSHHHLQYLTVHQHLSILLWHYLGTEVVYQY